MKKTAAMILALVLTLSLSAAAMAEDTYRVGICQLVQHVALDAATQGFQDALKEKLGDKVTFDVQNASGDSNTCSTIVNNFISGGVNLIMATWLPWNSRPICCMSCSPTPRRWACSIAPPSPTPNTRWM